MSETLSVRYRVATRTRLMRAILVVAALLAVFSAVLFQAPELVGRPKILTDFDAFHIAGTMAGQGMAAEAYDTDAMLKAQQEISGTRSFMPWTYPPPYTLVVDALARLPIGLSYLLFVSLSFAAYFHVLRRIAGKFLPGVILTLVPTIVLIVRTGQNGFLTGAMTGWFLLLFLERKNGGVPLGLMVIKPHLAGGIAILSLLERRWATMAIAATIVLASLVTPTLVYGPGIWPAFFAGVKDAANFLALGWYPLFRMTSLYAAVRSFGGSPSLSITVHAIGAACALALFLLVWLRCRNPRWIAAAACIASLFLSPYNYDYDLTILGIAIALVLPDLLARASTRELLAMYVMTWIISGYGLAINGLMESTATTTVATMVECGTDETSTCGMPSIIGPGLLVLIWAAVSVLRRPAGALREATAEASETNEETGPGHSSRKGIT